MRFLVVVVCFLTRAISKKFILFDFVFDVCACMFCFILICVWTNFVDFEEYADLMTCMQSKTLRQTEVCLQPLWLTELKAVAN